MLPEDNIESENFQMWHDWHGKEAQCRVKEVHDCPLSPCCCCIHICIHTFFMIFKFYANTLSSKPVSSMWGKLNRENHALRLDYLLICKLENPIFLCLIYQDQIVLSREASVSRQSLFPGKWLTSQHKVSDIKSFIFVELHIKCTLI